MGTECAKSFLTLNRREKVIKRTTDPSEATSKKKVLLLIECLEKKTAEKRVLEGILLK